MPLTGAMVAGSLVPVMLRVTVDDGMRQYATQTVLIKEQKSQPLSVKFKPSYSWAETDLISKYLGTIIYLI
jgi:hypothetical protein